VSGSENMVMSVGKSDITESRMSGCMVVNMRSEMVVMYSSDEMTSVMTVMAPCSGSCVVSSASSSLWLLCRSYSGNEHNCK
jgi:hypothetical protein